MDVNIITEPGVKLSQQVAEAAEWLQTRDPRTFDLGVVLGTGLGSLVDEMTDTQRISYGDIPHFPHSTVKFHAGQLVLGRLEGKTLFAMQGRFHGYEGHALQAVTLPIRVMHRLGMRTLILTNAAGGIRPQLTPGSIALITDHLNLMGSSPLTGPYEETLGTRFPDMSEPYSRRLRALALRIALDLGIPLHESVYAAVIGPSYETEAEINMLQVLGADTVGMSVVPETLVARQLDMEVLGLTAVTDQALPGAMRPLSHEEVNRMAAELGPRFRRLLRTIIKTL